MGCAARHPGAGSCRGEAVGSGVLCAASGCFYKMWIVMKWRVGIMIVELGDEGPGWVGGMCDGGERG